MEIITKLQNATKEYLTSEQQTIAEQIAIEASSYKFDNNLIAIAYLINAPIDNIVLANSIKQGFGEQVLSKLQLMKRISTVSIPDTQRHIANLRKIFIEITDDLRLIIIKIIERLHSLKNVAFISADNARQLAEECLYLYAPIAHRLGISRLYNPIEETAFKYIEPVEYKKIHKAIELRRENLERKLIAMSHNLNEELKKHRIDATIKHRVKRPFSIYRKLKKQNITIDGIYDLMALRIITYSEEQCYLALGIVHSKWEPIERRFRDWITFPKPNGYRSIQTTVFTKAGDKFEVQIRTEEMDIESEYGSSAHWAYKEGGKAKDEMWVKKLKDFLENDDYFDNPIDVYELLKNEMKSDYIHVLTPMGKVVSLIEGATPIDFAFALHTDLGYKVTGARINGKYAKLKSELKSGDVVEIVSANSSKPSRDWLEFVKTTRSRSKILRWFKNNERDLLIADGRRSWERIKKQFKAKLRGYDDEATFKKSISTMGFTSIEDFFWQIANNNVKCTLTLLKKIFPKAFEKAVNASEKTAIQDRNRKKGPQIKVEGQTGIESVIARCCNPIKGERIVAFITKKSQLKIHKSSCSYISTNLVSQEQIKQAEWLDDKTKQSVNLKIFAIDIAKALSALVNEAASACVVVLSTETQALSKKAKCLATGIQVDDVEHLRNFVAKIRNISGIETVKIT